MTNYIRIKPLAAESLGIRSMATLIETPDIKLLIDPSAAVGKRYGYEPHPLEYKRLKEKTEEIISFSKNVEIIVISHYHFDHYFPFFKNYAMQWSNYDLATELYHDKVILAKGIDANITERQQKRGKRFEALSKNIIREIIWADSKRFEFGNTILKFSTAVEHGFGKKFLGYILMLVIMYADEKFMYVPDVYGPVSTNILHYILKEYPDILYIDGPPLYLKEFGLGRISLKKVEKNLGMIINKINNIILDHHLFRGKNGLAFLNMLREREEANISSVAEYLKKKPSFFEAERKKLWEEKPPSVEFIKWTKLEPEIRRRTPPPLVF